MSGFTTEDRKRIKEGIQERDKVAFVFGCLYWLGASLALSACVAVVNFFATDFGIVMIAAVILGVSLLAGTLAFVAQMAFIRFGIFLALSGHLGDLREGTIGSASTSDHLDLDD